MCVRHTIISISHTGTPQNLIAISTNAYWEKSPNAVHPPQMSRFMRVQFSKPLSAHVQNVVRKHPIDLTKNQNDGGITYNIYNNYSLIV
jgi:hypothetical protein